MKSSPEKLRVVIVDDEPIAREGVRVQLKSIPDVAIVAECANGIEAVAAIREHCPDLVFLDVQMPGMDGFEVLEEVGVEQLPSIVFVTAYDKYALRAFEVNAIDYLLKPFDKERFHKAFNRARAAALETGRDSISHRLQSLLSAISHPPHYLERLVVKTSGRIFFLPTSEIDWIESADNYVSVHVGRHSHLIRETLTALEAKLNPAEFIRIRHSAIVNLKHVRELHPLFKGEYEIVLHNETKLRTSRRYRQKLSVLLGE